MAHAERVLAQLASQRRWGFLCDCLVVIGDTQFRAHRAVLAACSALFRMIFIQADSRGQQSLDLSHTGVSAHYFDRILQYMYHGHSTAVSSEQFQELKASMQLLQMDFVPETLEDLSRVQEPGSGSGLMFGVRMFPTRPGPGPGSGPGPGLNPGSGQESRLGPGPETSSSTGNSRPLSVEELLVAPSAGEDQCDVRRSLRRASERLKERPRFGRTFTCDDCGFVFSCEKLLIEHILTCTNRKNPPQTQTRIQSRDPGQDRSQDQNRERTRDQGQVCHTDTESSRSPESGEVHVKTEPEDWTRTETGPGPGPGSGPVNVKEEPEDPEPSRSYQNQDSAKRIKIELRPGQEQDQDQDQDQDESHCELCGLELKGGDLAAHYVADHTSHICACGRCGQVLPKGRRLQEHAQRCAQNQVPVQDRDQDREQDQDLTPGQTPDLQDQDQDQPENPEEESEDEDHEEEEMDCPLLDTCENAGSSLAGLAPAAFSSDEPRRRHFCGICGRGFFQRCHLREHYTVHTKHKQFTCHTCGKGFLRQRQLRLHQDMHRGVARYVCPVCEQGTFLKQDHVRHMISHLSPGETICQVCFQMFPGAEQLERHLEVHLYVCSVCGEKFRLRKDMRSHYHSTHHKRV